MGAVSHRATEKPDTKEYESFSPRSGKKCASHSLGPSPRKQVAELAAS